MRYAIATEIRLYLLPGYAKPINNLKGQLFIPEIKPITYI